MRHGSAGRRHRNRGHSQGGNGGGHNGNHNGNNNGNRRGNHNRMQVFDSNGPEVRIRGTAYQVVEKYLTLAKDAASAGDRVLSESYLQHAEHYQRIISTWEEDVQFSRPVHGSSDQPQPNGYQARPQQPQQSSDLSLPASILGGSPKAESQEPSQARTSELTS